MASPGSACGSPFKLGSLHGAGGNSTGAFSFGICRPLVRFSPEIFQLRPGIDAASFPAHNPLQMPTGFDQAIRRVEELV
jgi:hypothetical protein